MSERRAGFTLIELLLAMAITALAAIMAYGGLSAAATAAARQREQTARLEAAATALGWLTRDLRYALARPVTDAHGAVEPGLWAGEPAASLLALTRSGWSNRRGSRRGQLQRVRYRLDVDGTLWREHWRVLDRVSETAAYRQLSLLEHVTAVEIAFLDPAGAALSPHGGQWVDEWPPAVPAHPLPLAVRLRFELAGLGNVERIVVLPEAIASTTASRP